MIELSQDSSLALGDVQRARDSLPAQQWHDAVTSPGFRSLIAAKRRLVGPLLGFSLVFILGMTLLAGYGRPLMAVKVVGAFNVGYLLILLTYVLCWVVAVIYVNVANENFDRLAGEAAAEAAGGVRS